MDKRRQTRVPKTVQMVQGQDDDLIAWFASLPPREVNKQIKAVLREGLGFTTRNTAPIEPDAPRIETLQQELYDFMRYVYARFDAQPDTVSTIEQVYQEEPLIGESELKEREAKLMNMGW